MNSEWEKLCAHASSEIEATLSELPEALREHAVKLPVTFEPFPNEDLQKDGIDPDTLGLFTGAEMAENDGNPMPSQIILFLENLWNLVEGDEKAFREEIRTTFLHELGHFLGLDEDDLTARGLE